MRRRNWLAIQVELIAGHGQPLWPRPGRLFAVARSHTFAEFGVAVDQALARWDVPQPAEFILADGVRIGRDKDTEDSTLAKIGELNQGDRFAYVFDPEARWEHLCTVVERPFDPRKTRLRGTPELPTPYWGWGSLPDQHGMRWPKDDGSKAGPRQPAQPYDDLPPLLPGWGSA
ncbi:hypothetical protein [Cryptosporangium aurantiacum]|uniref:Uncharacterized protein n=1 Tax=Cryptosporangium aurantiacum TaxID=134849 RepID=A0A1M7RD55_9ACTN|nr:hypothetical protein [Cryptosporangium aurantiacum]SHN44120.1 hypothetical protein SAMN05443668_11069 [Cryptosporangium aurantiacum]